MKLVGLDFETANPSSGSICAAGITFMENGSVREKREWLIRPHHTVDWMLSAFTKIHGIGYFDLRDALEFPEIWTVMKSLIWQGDCVVIHNAPFDLRHLHTVLTLYRLPSFSFDYVCSLAVCRYLFPGMSSHSLDAMAAHFNIEFQHHDALEDAITCAAIIVQTGIPQNFIKQFEYHCKSE